MMRALLQGSLDRSSDHRGAERHLLRLTAAIDSRPGGAITVHNLSHTGLLIASDTALAKGEEILVEFAGGARHCAEVVWADDTLFGCRFNEPLSRASLSAALLRASPPGPAPLKEVHPSQSSIARVPAPGALTLRAKALIIGGAALACWACLASTAYLLVW